MAVGGIGPPTHRERIRHFGGGVPIRRIGGGIMARGQMSTLMADAHGDGKRIFELLSALQERTTELHIAHLTFAAMVRIRILEQRVEELKAECARLEAVTRVGY